MPVFEKKNLVVEAIQITGTNTKTVKAFLKGTDYSVFKYMGFMFIEQEAKEKGEYPSSKLADGHWIVKDPDGKISVMNDKHFQQEYKEKL